MAGTEVRPLTSCGQARLYRRALPPARPRPHWCRHCASASTTAYPGAIRPGPSALGAVDGARDGKAWAASGVHRFQFQRGPRRVLGVVASSMPSTTPRWRARFSTSPSTVPAQGQDGRRAGQFHHQRRARPPCRSLTPGHLLTLENPTYYEQLWTGAGWEQAMTFTGTCSSGTPRRCPNASAHPAEVA